ncbi:hypothetical protein C0J52_12249 [Blattella germanica]|nr:hypothetical protein C0J52_12249 [Blattella germanica]
MVLKEGGSAILAAVSFSSLFLALSVYYVVDNIARPTDSTQSKNYLKDIEEGEPKVTNPLTEILYNQLFNKKSLEMCPVYLKDSCRWDIIEDKNATQENTTKKQLIGAIRRSCQIFGIVKYQDVCFYEGENLFEIQDSARIAQILKDCAYVNDRGYPCLLSNNIKPEMHSPKNVCVSDSKTFKNVVTHRCRVPESLDSSNDSNVIPLEDIIYDGEINTFRNKNGQNGDTSSTSDDGNQQYKSGSNKTTTGTNATTVVCHIFLAALLIVSASVALYEVCRDRLSDKKFGQHSIIADGRINAIGSRSSSLDSRRCSLVDLTMSRHARRESVQHSAVQQQVNLQEPSNSSISTMHHSQIKLLGNSFPVHIGATASVIPKDRAPTPSGVVTPAKSRRTSVDGSEDDSSPDLTKRRVRFLRRH